MRFLLSYTYFYIAVLICVFFGGSLPSLGWLIFALLLAVLEVGHPGLFFFLSFALGSSFTALASIVVLDMTTQVFIFFGMSGIFFKFLQKYVRFTQKSSHPTNVDALINQKALVIKEIIPPNLGQVKIKGQLWQAQSSRGQEIKSGLLVHIQRVEGTRLIVQ